MADERRPEQGLHRLVRFVGVSTAITPLLTLLVSVVIARTLGPEGRGAYGVVVATVSILPPILGLGLEFSIRYWSARGEASRRSVLKTSTVLGLAVGAVSALSVLGWAALGAPEWLVPAGLSELGVGCFAAILLLAGMRGFWTNYLMGQERYGYGTFGRNLAMGIQVAALGSVWWAATMSLDAVVGALALQYLVGFGLFFALDGREWWRSLREPLLPRSEFVAMLRYGWWQYLSALLLQTEMRLNVFLLAALGGLYETGLYTAVLGPASLLWVLAAPLNIVLTARTARRADDADFPARVGSALRLTFSISLLGSVVAAAAAPSLLPLVFGEKFAEAVGPFWILLPGTLAFSLTRVITQYLAGAGRPEWNSRIAAVGACATVALSVALIPSLGAVGGALATSIAYVASTALALFAFGQVSGLPRRELLRFRRDDWLPLFRVAGLDPGRLQR